MYNYNFRLGIKQNAHLLKVIYITSLNATTHNFRLYLVINSLQRPLFL